MLVPLAWIYRILLSLRRRSAGARRRPLPVPVIVVGNVTVGGTGKTPLVIWLVQRLRALGYSPGIVTRGYLGTGIGVPIAVTAAASPQQVGDEPVLLARRLDCPVTACRDRVAGVRQLLSDADVDVVAETDPIEVPVEARRLHVHVLGAQVAEYRASSGERIVLGER